MCSEVEGHRVAGDGGRVESWEEMKEALRDGGPDKEQREQMQLSEQASDFNPTGFGNGKKMSWAKGMINRRLGELAKSVAGFTRGKETLVPIACGTCRCSVLIWRCAHGVLLSDTRTKSLDNP